MNKASTQKLSARLSALASGTMRPDDAQARQALTDALASKDVHVIVRAAELIAQHELRSFDEALRTAYGTLCGPHAGTRDPGALAKEALVAALEAIDSPDAELFAEAAMHVQRERTGKRGVERDTAAGVRARGVLGLARLGHPDLWPILGMCLADANAGVRLSAARAVAHREQREGAGLLLLRLGVGDDTPEVLSECLRGLFAIAPELGLRYARNALRDASEETRAHTLHALGTAPNDGAVDLLIEELTQRALASERQPVIEALGLSLRPKARETLLDLLQCERLVDAEAALSALAIHKHDTRLASQVKERTARSRELARRFRELFRDAV